MISECEPLVIEKKPYELKSKSRRQVQAVVFVICHNAISDSLSSNVLHPVFLYKDMNPFSISMLLGNGAQHVSPLHRPPMLKKPVF